MKSSEGSQSEKAYKEIKHRILTQDLKSGYPVAEIELANDMNMSRTPVREALRRLESDGLLEVIPRKGTYIKSFSISDLIKIYEVAEGLEGMVAYLVAEKAAAGDISPETVKELEAYIQEMDRLEKEEDYRSWAEADEAFHRVLYVICENKMLSDILNRTRAQLNITLFKTVPSYVNINESNNEHRELLASIRSGLPEEARSLNQKQHNRVRNNLLKNGRLY